MASSGGTSVNPPNRHPTAVPQRFNNISPYPHESSSVQTNTCPQFNQGYNKPKPVGIPHSFPQQFSELRPSSTPIRVNDTGANTMPLYRRGHRREMNHSYNSARHPSNPRSYNGRVARGHMNNSGQMQSLDLGQSSNAAAALASNWNRWNGTRWKPWVHLLHICKFLRISSCQSPSNGVPVCSFVLILFASFLVQIYTEGSIFLHLTDYVYTVSSKHRVMYPINQICYNELCQRTTCLPK